MLKYDLHVATESCDDENLERALVNLGLTDDKLVNRHFNFYGSVAVSACPLIELHMSKKYGQEQTSDVLTNVRKDIKQIEALMRHYHVTGYAHAEVTRSKYDLTITSNKEFYPCIPWPIARFQPGFSTKEHRWDIHVAIPIDELPSQLATIIEQGGMYSIERLKTRNGITRIFSVYTIQGSCPAKDGRLLFDSLVKWFHAVNAPYIEIKMETYITLIKVGKPTILPPVVDRVQFVPGVQYQQPLVVNAF